MNEIHNDHNEKDTGEIVASLIHAIDSLDALWLMDEARSLVQPIGSHFYLHNSGVLPLRVLLYQFAGDAGLSALDQDHRPMLALSEGDPEITKWKTPYDEVTLSPDEFEQMSEEVEADRKKLAEIDREFGIPTREEIEARQPAQATPYEPQEKQSDR